MRGFESVVVTVSGIIQTGSGGVSSFSLAAGAGAAASCILNDSIDGTGDDVWVLAAVAGGSVTVCFPELLLFGEGIYCIPSGVGVKASIAFT